MNNKIWVMQLTSGTQVIGEFYDSDDYAIYFTVPFEMSLSYDVTGASKLYVTRYLPYASDLRVAIMRGNIESMVVASQPYVAFYRQKVKQFDQLRTQSQTQHQDLAFENDEGEQSDMDESLATHTSDPNTKH